MRRPILVVEDNPSDLELLLLALERCELEQDVVSVIDGQEALDYLNREGAFRLRAPIDPDFVLMDIKMPKVTGLEVLKEIRANPDLRAVPVIALRGSREERDIVQAYDLGINGYVVKASNFRDFRRDIAGIASMWGHLNEAPPRFRHRGEIIANLHVNP